MTEAFNTFSPDSIHDPVTNKHTTHGAGQNAEFPPDAIYDPRTDEYHDSHPDPTLAPAQPQQEGQPAHNVAPNTGQDPNFVPFEQIKR